MPSETNKISFFERIQYAAEYAVLFVLDLLIGILPERLAVCAGICVGKVYYFLSPYRRNIARRNLELAMPGKYSGEELDRIVKEVFVNIGLTTVESVWMKRRTDKAYVLSRLPLEGVAAALEAMKAGKGAITFSPHLGNWEMLGASVAAHLGGLNALARPTNNPYVEKYVTSTREKMNITVLSTREGVRPMIAALREGQAIGILIDQHVNRAGVEAKFFGRPAATTAVVSSLALRMDVPVFFCYTLREGRSFRHHGYVSGPVKLIDSGNKEADVLSNTQMLNDMIESAIKTKPEQWLWTHRRWKLAETETTSNVQKELATNA